MPGVVILDYVGFAARIDQQSLSHKKFYIVVLNYSCNGMELVLKYEWSANSMYVKMKLLVKHYLQNS